MVTDGQDMVRGKPWDCTYHANLMLDRSGREAVMTSDEENNAYDLEAWERAYPQNCSNIVADTEVCEREIGECPEARKLGFVNLKGEKV
jgi:hypothetical protein